ncbi:THAP domain-containing protein 4 [Ditylenchus destructor]|uniref:THAP domain-containing protein 4 n=1 Tax=Ditylenchus destructor TaxID=166010 RepID=A0AAD4N826_9BILA|nr:THAP domain-containing protein 4 [Ditylenchus destructor]
MFVGASFSSSNKKCIDRDMNCYVWVAKEPQKCLNDENVVKFCKRSCQDCGNDTVLDIDPKYDIRNVPENLQKIAFLIGQWKSEFGGKADFPTIPKFTYGEKLEISLSRMMKTPVLNYTAFAWDNSDLKELHQENGFISGSRNSSVVSMNLIMSNGFVTIEEGEERMNSIRFRLRRIGRINFSRDLPVRKMVREWILLNETHLESRLLMATATHPMLLHTSIIYKKIYP